MSEPEDVSELTFVDDYEVSDVVEALRSMAWSDKARALVTALATAPARALSRFEMAQVIGSNSVNATNSVLGHFAKALALELDADLEAKWKPTDGRSRGDWVIFACVIGRRFAVPIEGEPDSWVFVMRETLAQALSEIGVAPFHEISDDAADALWPFSDDDADDEDAEVSDGPFANPVDDISAAEELGELNDLEPTEREAVISARVGQGRFREALLARWDGRCAVTGIALTEVIVASHIKPWALSSNAERLDPANGLPLIGTLDRLFDYGLISFDAAGVIMFSSFIPENDYGLLNLHPELCLRFVTPETAAYLAFHREECFRVSVEDGEVDVDTED